MDHDLPPSFCSEVNAFQGVLFLGSTIVLIDSKLPEAIYYNWANNIFTIYLYNIDINTSVKHSLYSGELGEGNQRNLLRLH